MRHLTFFLSISCVLNHGINAYLRASQNALLGLRTNSEAHLHGSQFRCKRPQAYFVWQACADEWESRSSQDPPALNKIHARRNMLSQTLMFAFSSLFAGTVANAQSQPTTVQMPPSSVKMPPSSGLVPQEKKYVEPGKDRNKIKVCHTLSRTLAYACTQALDDLRALKHVRASAICYTCSYFFYTGF
jgi:hypothetical protein